jgi:uncharacterized membrane protein
MDTHVRTLLKTITWRIVAVVITVLGIYLFEESWSLALIAGVIINIIKTLFYYIHERVWAAIAWQHKKQDSYLRTFIKTISWKLITVVITTVIMLFYVNWKIALASGFSINFVKAIFYYFHERIWNLTSYGRKKKN